MISLILEIFATLALVCGFSMAPLEPVEPWEPDPQDVAYISQTLWGEVRGCDEIEIRAQAWCVLNRVDDPRFPDTIAEVVKAPYQFQGYSPNNPIDPFKDVSREILIMWHNGERELPENMVFCWGDGVHQYFRSEWTITERTEYYP